MLVVLAFASQGAFAQLCTTTATAPAFGNYQASSSGSPANGSVSVTCIVVGAIGQTVFYTVQLGRSAQAQGTQRRLLSSGNYLRYNVYCDGQFTSIWADGTESTCTRTGGQSGLIGTLLTVFPVYGNIPGGQFVPAGSYTDSIAVQVLY